MAHFPRRLVLDVIWLMSGKGQPWTNPAECNLILKNTWDAFPPDVTPEEIGLPTATAATPLGITNPSPDGTSVHSNRSRHRQTYRANREPKLEHITEQDVTDQRPNQTL
jgi:hypothetical protein